jgi:rod shape determining protein RodA
MSGSGYNTNQSEIAIGSGGWLGFPRGHTQTKGLCSRTAHRLYLYTVGEEWGFAGSLVVMALFAGLLLRIIYLAERQNKIQ